MEVHLSIMHSEGKDAQKILLGPAYHTGNEQRCSDTEDYHLTDQKFLQYLQLYNDLKCIVSHWYQKNPICCSYDISPSKFKDPVTQQMQCSARLWHRDSSLTQQLHPTQLTSAELYQWWMSLTDQHTMLYPINLIFNNKIMCTET